MALNLRFDTLVRGHSVLLLRPKWHQFILFLMIKPEDLAHQRMQQLEYHFCIFVCNSLQYSRQLSFFLRSNIQNRFSVQLLSYLLRMQAEIFHPYYTNSTLEEADAVAWVLTDKDAEFQQFPFKFQPLEPVDVRIKILHTSICQSDVLHSRGKWSQINYPCCPGHEIVAQVTQIGSEVTSLKVGDKVGVSPVRYSDLTCRYCKMGHTQMCQQRQYLYDIHFGGYCTHMQINNNWAIKIPEGLDLKEVPPLLCAGVTVYAPIKRFHKIGGSCAVLGIGGLGHLAIQYANKLGMNVTAFTTRLNNLPSLKEMGAYDAQHSTNEEELKKNQGKYDLVVSTLYIEDPKIYKLQQRLTKRGGVYLMLGAPNAKVSYEIDSQYLIDNEITVAGSNVGSINEVRQMLQFSAHYGVKSINQYFNFEDLPKAFHRTEKETPRYRCVINVTDWAKKNGFDK